MQLKITEKLYSLMLGETAMPGRVPHPEVPIELQRDLKYATVHKSTHRKWTPRSRTSICQMEDVLKAMQNILASLITSNCEKVRCNGLLSSVNKLIMVIQEEKTCTDIK